MLAFCSPGLQQSRCVSRKSILCRRQSRGQFRSGIGFSALPSPGGIGIELELPSFELELESELRSSELPSWN